MPTQVQVSTIAQLLRIVGFSYRTRCYHYSTTRRLTCCLSSSPPQSIGMSTEDETMNVTRFGYAVSQLPSDTTALKPNNLYILYR